MDIRTIKEEDETQVDTLTSSITRTIHRSGYIPRRQLSNQKQDRYKHKLDLIDATSSFFCEIEQCQCIIVYTMYSSYYYIYRNLVITPILDSLDVKFISIYY